MISNGILKTRMVTKQYMKHIGRGISGTYGGYKTPCNVLVYGIEPSWYVVEGSVNINIHSATV